MQIELGALVESLMVQTGCKSESMRHLELDRVAMDRCYIRGFMPRSNYDRAQKQLVKKVSAALSASNGAA